MVDIPPYRPRAENRSVARQLKFLLGQGLPRAGSQILLALLVGLGGGLLPPLVFPPTAAAYTSRLNLFLVREEGESFDSFVRRSEIIARAAVQRSFDADVLMTNVIVTIIGDSQGITLPVLTVSVSRQDWQLKPDVPTWATYYDSARTLMPQP